MLGRAWRTFERFLVLGWKAWPALLFAFGLVRGALAADAPTCTPSDYALNLPYILSKLQANPCQGRGTSLFGDLDNKILFVCVGDVAKASYPFAYGQNGFPKTTQGDMKTPVGTYSLGTPRNSEDGFGTFIPIIYPTPEQAAAGYTGSDVGIHGPPRDFACAGLQTVEVNWTWGCVAMPSDPAIKAIADFVTQNPTAKITLFTRQTSSAK